MSKTNTCTRGSYGKGRHLTRQQKETIEHNRQENLRANLRLAQCKADKPKKGEESVRDAAISLGLITRKEG